jgi:hypothetical protein
VHVAGPQRAPLQVAELVEHEQRVIAGAAEVAVVGAAFLPAVRLADAAVHVEHDHRVRPARMNPVDPGAGEIGQGGEVRLAGQPARLEPPHLAGRGGPAIQPATIDHRAYRRIMRQALGVVHILIAGEAAEHGLPQQPGQEMAGVPPTTAFRQHATGHVGQPEGVVQLPVGQQAGVGRDTAAVELQLQAAIEIDPQGAVIRFTRWVVHRAVTQEASTY